MSFLDPSGTFLNFYFLEVLLSSEEPVCLFGCWQVSNAERFDSPTQDILCLDDQNVFSNES